MRKATNEAVNAVVRDLTELPGGDAFDISLHVMSLISEITGAESDLKDCVNELCLKCGTYRNPESKHFICGDCRWEKVKEGFR